MRFARYAAGALLAVGLTAMQASASIITFTGEDLNAQPGGPFPNSNAAAASFDSAAGLIGPENIINFESAPLGSFSSLNAAPGVTITGSDAQGDNQQILNAPNPAFPPLDGYNTTPGGSQFLEMKGGSVTFTFASPVQFFGAYFSGVQTSFFQDTVQFSDGSSESINVPGTGTSSSEGAAAFVGFTDAGASISSITINTGTNGFDFIGVDDVRYGAAASTAPEPASIVIAFAGLAALAAIRYRNGRRHI